MLGFEGIGVGSGETAVLRRITARLPAGAFRWLIGPPGAGKTTLLEIAALGRAPDAGRLFLFNEEIGKMRRRDLPALRRRIGMVFQEPCLPARGSALEIAGQVASLAGWPARAVREAAWEALHRVGIDPTRATLSADAMTANERRRLAIARAIAHRPALLLADEPAIGLAAAQVEALWRLLQTVREGGAAIVVACADETLAERFGGGIWRLRAGRLAESLPDPSC